MPERRFCYFGIHLLTYRGALPVPLLGYCLPAQPRSNSKRYCTVRAMTALRRLEACPTPARLECRDAWNFKQLRHGVSTGFGGRKTQDHAHTVISLSGLLERSNITTCAHLSQSATSHMRPDACRDTAAAVRSSNSAFNVHSDLARPTRRARRQRIHACVILERHPSPFSACLACPRSPSCAASRRTGLTPPPWPARRPRWPALART